MTVFRAILRLGLGAIFAWAAVVKILEPREFLDAIQSYHLLSGLPAGIVAVWLPWLELTLAVALWVPRVSRAATGMIAILCTLFLASLVQAWLRGIDITCGCFGDSSVVSGSDYLPYVARDVALVIAALLLWRVEKKTAPTSVGAVNIDP